jgi:nicotinate-nucleotide adenylyltransferase
MVGLFFGSFNPIHIGHLALANYYLDNTELKEIWFVISPHNPLKNKSTLLHHRFRKDMVNLAIGDHPKLKACDIEFNLPQPSYTINTLEYLKEKYPKKKFALILGADNLATFHKWKNYEVILKRHHLFVYPRPGFDPGPLVIHPSVTLTNAPIIEISSSYIRDAIHEGKKPEYFVHPEVWKYICEMSFYKK